MMHAFDRIVDYMEPEHDEEDVVVDRFGDDADHTGTSPVLPPRVITAFVLLVFGLILVVGVRDASTPEGWSAWVMVPALAMYAVAAWLLRVECRDPWDGGAR